MKFSNNFFAIILIGGMGTRFSKINEPPKQLIKLNKRSLLENLIISFVRSGINNFVLPMGYKKNFFQNFLKKKKKILNKNIKIFKGKVNKVDRENINIVDNALDKVSKLRGVSFDWKREGKGSSIGLIAQDVEPILPELVSEAPTFGDSTDTHKTLNYNGIIGLLVESIKELKDEIQELKNARSK